MKKASKLLALCLALLICAACTACQSSPEKAVQETPTTEEISVEEESPVTEETTAIEATTAAFKPVVVREAPEYVLPEEKPEDITEENTGKIVVPYTLSTDEMLQLPEMKGKGEFDGSYCGSIAYVRDNIVAVDLYEYVVYDKTDIQNLVYGDKILIKDKLVHVNTTLWEHQDTKTGNVTIALDGDETTPFGDRSLFLMYEFSGFNLPNDAYCVDYAIDDLAYREYVKTIEVPLGYEIDVNIDDQERKTYTDAEFIDILKKDNNEFMSIYNEVVIYDDTLWYIRIDNMLKQAMEGEINKVENDIVDNAINPIYSLEKLQELVGQTANGAVANYRGCLTNVEDGKATIDIYKTDFYSVNDLRKAKPGDFIVINGEKVEIAVRKDVESKHNVELLIDTDSNSYYFRPAYSAITDYCLADEYDPVVSYYKTIEVEIADNIVCGYSKQIKENEYSLETMSFDEIWTLLKNNPDKNKPNLTNITFLNGKLFGYIISDTYDKYGVRSVKEMTGWN